MLTLREVLNKIEGKWQLTVRVYDEDGLYLFKEIYSSTSTDEVDYAKDYSNEEVLDIHAVDDTVVVIVEWIAK